MNRRTDAESFPNEPGAQRWADEGLRAWRFDAFEFDLRRGELKGADGATIALRPKAEVLLRQFLVRPGELLAREDLMGAIWPRAVVTDDSLVQCVGELRVALGDRAQRLIRTVPRRGYRFEAAVESVKEAVTSSPAPADTDDLPAGNGDPISEPLAVAEDGGGAARIEVAVRPDAARVPRRILVGVILAAAVLLGVTAWRWQAASARPGIDAEITARHAFAVMPFAADAGHAGLREIADRVADQIAAHIASQPGTRCIGRSRTMALAAMPPAQIAAELGVVYVFTGRVSSALRPGQAAVVDVQLVATADGALVGAEHFDLGNGAGSAEDLGQEVMNFMRGRVMAIDEAVATRAGHEPSAAELALLGWGDIYRRSGSRDMVSARERFERALLADPNSIIALDGLGAVNLQELSSRTARTPARMAEAQQVIDRALRLAPNDATASLNWGNLQSLQGRPDLAIPAIEKSNRIVPGYVNGHLMLARAYLSVGRIGEVHQEAERAVRLASLSRDAARASAALQLGAEAALMQHDDAQAIDLARRAVAERPNNFQAHAVLAAATALSGDIAQATDEMTIGLRLAPHATIDRFDESRPSSEPRYVAARARFYAGLRAAGMPDS